MNKVWFKGIEPAYEKEIRGDYASSLVTRNRLVKILEEKVETSLTKSRSETSYDSPNWDRLIADSIGYQRALKDVIKLISES